ncbi:PQQ-binding-like beta-propeller repeat protein [Streptomyces ficellus]|uniref:PQQ-binding-like beta-propeller repeat protein n=1 Tax=Streptomyces ficellus TaxID=1977088 RepID=A0ABT7YZV3_9ACTN|nr:PQQ-binding-like beta-propeller repeat protein [Streptomyces ficellus]MDN3292778.1 PQQ-binding-like beta-propeller repeat protein [Streptomyces ficellus]
MTANASARARGTRRGRRIAAGRTGLTGLAVLALLVGSGSTGPHSAGAAAPAKPHLRGHEPAADWPIANGDLSNTRATTRTPINSKTVRDLKVKWRLPLTGKPTFAGLMASNPIVVGGTVYAIDLNSNVYAVDKETGRVRWKREFDDPSVGPNGVAYRHGLLLGTTFTSAFALDARTGRTVWSRHLIDAGKGGVDVAPQVYGRTVVVSTVPSTFGTYVPGTMGTVWALDIATGKPKWSFNTVKDGDLWGHPEINSGGGLWFPPAIDSQGRIFLAVGNPAPMPGTPEYPNGSSRPGPNLYTNSLVALDGRTGKLLWYRQALPHDIRDYDLQISPILTTVPIRGKKTGIVIVAGKMGKVFAYRADDGEPLWTRSVGIHLNDEGPLPNEPVTIYPGVLGGVETPMASAEGRVFVPWVDLPSEMSATGGMSYPGTDGGRGGLAAVDTRTGKVQWQRALPQMPLGAATVTNDVVFCPTYDGRVFAFDTRTGKTLWTATTPAGINSFPAVSGDTLLVGAGVAGDSKEAQPALIAYSLEAERPHT